jgi:DNA polymerase III delta subunit
MNKSEIAEPARFLLLIGNDSISREKAKQNAVEAIRLKTENAEISRFDPDIMTFASYCESALTPSLFQTVRIFTLRDVHNLKKDDLAMLKSLFSYDIPDVYMIMESDISRVRKSKEKPGSKDFENFIDNFNRHAGENPGMFAFFEFPQPAEYKMAQWVETQTPLLLGRNISHKDAEYLVDLVGSDSASLYSELQKIDIYLPAQKPIDKNAIDTISGATRMKSQFELAQALGKRNFPKVLETIDSLYSGSVYVPLYIAAIFRHFWALFRIYIFAKENPDDVKKFEMSIKRFNKEVQETTGLKIGVAAGLLSEKQRSSVFPVLVKSDIVSQASQFTGEQYRKIFRWLGDYDIGIKTGKIDDSKTGFQLLCYRIYKVAEID